jgi:hypothetical protein
MAVLDEIFDRPVMAVSCLRKYDLNLRCLHRLSLYTPGINRRLCPERLIFAVRTDIKPDKVSPVV